MNSRIVVAALAALLLGGCGVRTGFLRDSRTSQELRFDMQISSVRYVKTVSASSDVGLLFCSIPLSDDAYSNAMQRLYTSAQLKENEFLAHFREDQGFTWYLGFYCRMGLTISADVLHVTPVHGRVHGSAAAPGPHIGPATGEPPAAAPLAPSAPPPPTVSLPPPPPPPPSR
ncbi:MAG: hypothetical protein ACK4N5_04700 [Myxococcales bacterium]